ncbi:glycosyltransferase family 4 protein [Vibrio brasiliensis]|uniref:Glycosyl transferase group 1 n=1 Tax=Vibrio brasiliensis LMG 20546 TaxID=945543 RepID=E8LWU3_9VIBR|nr:glycosyltransferase family 4 protein [Vibrio brasiliensis]EGA64844.1 glycosyl transferase group 1 [Vibrio brasiliensis LMG 20546]
MKAAYVCSDRGVPVFGSKGCSLHVQEITRALIKSDIGVDLHAAAVGGQCPDDLKPIDVHRIRHAKLTDRALREQSDIDDNLTTMTELERSEPYDFVYERYSLWSYAGMSYAASRHIPAILEVNAPLIEEQKKYRGLIDQHAAVAVTERCFDDASLILTVSEQVADYVERYPQAHGKVKVLPNGVNTDRFAQVSHDNHCQFTFGFVGTLKPWHGVERLIAAFAAIHSRYPQTRLLIVGDGPMKDTLVSQVIELKLADCIEITGLVEPANMINMYQQMDVGVAPYPDDIEFYFSPLKVYEYMAAGLPVIGSDIGQISDIVTDGKTGLTCSASELEGLIKAMEFMVTHRSMSLVWGQAAQREAQAHHSWKQRVDNILAWSGLAPE